MGLNRGFYKICSHNHLISISGDGGMPARLPSASGQGARMGYSWHSPDIYRDLVRVPFDRGSDCARQEDASREGYTTDKRNFKKTGG